MTSSSPSMASCGNTVASTPMPQISQLQILKGPERQILTCNGVEQEHLFGKLLGVADIRVDDIDSVELKHKDKRKGK